MALTRVEVAERLEGAFDFGVLSRRQVIIAAELRGAPKEVLGVLGQLPEGTYASLRDLWPQLPDVTRSL